jgi:uncharacterized membrane protein
MTNRTMAARWHRIEKVARRHVTWGRLYHATSYLRSALWTVPIIAILLVLLLAPVVRGLDDRLQWHVSGLEVIGAQTLYQTVITLTLSFLVFTFGSLLVAIQVASGQLTPRIIATMLLRDNVVRFSVGLFTFTLIFAVQALNRQDQQVRDITALLTAVLAVACLADFLFLIDYAARLLRPVSIVARIGDAGVAIIQSVYPDPATAQAPMSASAHASPSSVRSEVEHRGRSDIVLAVDVQTLIALARNHDGLIELLPQVGDFVAAEEPLFALYGGATAIDNHALRSTVALGPERTLEQDPMFAFRIIVDIALKALSPAINDPTTAVLALDQLHRMLRVVSRRELRGEVFADDAGQPRLIFRTPNWDDFVRVACREIRACGASNLQVARRMRAMLDSLLHTLPEPRHAALREELDLLNLAIEAHFPFAEDLAQARIPDPQGLGGSAGARFRGSE